MTSGGTPVDSGTASSADKFYDGSRAGQFVTITVSYNFTPFFVSHGVVKSGPMTAGTAIQTN